ncbi:MAG TPA: methionyl-tRNA formyltransferase [Bacteroidetes bacterium]|nr:methionyl-tRNA formyltransferase [Bacteroidota bacterium]
MNPIRRIVFMGSPDFAVPALQDLHNSTYDVVGVITAPDKPRGRGQKIQSTAVKLEAKRLGIPVLQPKNLKDPGFQEELRNLKADIQVVIAFRMLPESVWNMPAYGSINLHASLLPDLRGAAPIHWAIINGYKKTGITTFQLQHAIDTGPILRQETVDIGENMTTGELYNAMRHMGGKMVLDSLAMIGSGAKQIAQSLTGKELPAPKIQKEDAHIQWDQINTVVHNHIRGMHPFPCAWTTLNDKRVKIHCARPTDKESTNLSPGEGFISIDNLLIIGCSSGCVEITELQLEGKKRMSAAAFVQGQGTKKIQFV